MKIRSLGYAGFAAPETAAWLEYATQILGLMPACNCPGEDRDEVGSASAGDGIAADGSVYLKMDDWQWRIAVHPAGDAAPGLLYLGLEVAGQAALEAAAEELHRAGAPVETDTGERARARSVTGLVGTRDPMGNAIELFYGPVIDRRYVSPLHMSFVAGNLGLGHLNLFAAPLAAARDFYTRVLGFRLTDYIRFGAQDSANFFHCNARHHSIGLLKMGELAGLHHLMLEAASVDMVCQCLERVQDAGIRITSTLGRHANDNMFSFYMQSPSGFEVEIGCDGRRVDENWTPHEFVGGDLWGHRGLEADTIAAEHAGREQGV